MGAWNRLTTEQLVALAPGDAVVIETAGEFRRPRHRDGTVLRISGSHIVITTKSTRGGTYQEHFGLRDGIRVGGPRPAQLVNGDGASTGSAPNPQAARIDALYREWRRNGTDETLRRLHEAIGGHLGVHV